MTIPSEFVVKAIETGLDFASNGKEISRSKRVVIGRLIGYSSPKAGAADVEFLSSCSLIYASTQLIVPDFFEATLSAYASLNFEGNA